MAVRKSQKAAEIPQGVVSTPVRNTALPPPRQRPSMSSGSALRPRRTRFPARPMKSGNQARAAARMTTGIVPSREPRGY